MGRTSAELGIMFNKDPVTELTCWGLWCLLPPSRSDGRRPASVDGLLLHAGTGI